MSRKTMNDVQKRIVSIFGESIKIVEAKVPLRLQPLPCDAVGAGPLSPDNCLLVHTAQRQHGSLSAIFWKNVAYIDLVDGEGNRQVERFLIARRTIKLMGDFDTGRPWKVGAAFILLPPKKSARRSYKRRVSAAYHASEVGKALGQLHKAKQRTRVAETQAEKAAEHLTELKASLPENSQKVTIAAKQATAMRKELATSRTNLLTVEKKVRRLRTHNKSHGGYQRKESVFDLTMRNGAAGNYRFMEQAKS